MIDESLLEKNKSESNWEKLHEYFRLSEYEAKVYIALIGAGYTKAAQISTKSGVPRTRVYTALRRLIDAGLVNGDSGKPERFLPVPPVEAFGKYLKEAETKTKGLLSIVSSLEKTFDETKKKLPESKTALWTIFRKENILKQMEEMLIKAKDKVEIAANEDGVILLYKEFRRIIDKLDKKSVKIQLSAPTQNLSKYLLEQVRDICKITDVNISLPLVLLNVDKKHLLLADMETSDTSSDSETALYSDNQILAEIIHILLFKNGSLSSPRGVAPHGVILSCPA